MPDQPLLLLDTNIVLLYVRGEAPAAELEAALGLSTAPQKPLVAGVSAGEILSIASRNRWGPPE